MREALSFARLGRPPAHRLRAGPSLARQHDRQSPACRGSGGCGGGGGGGGGLAGQKQNFGCPGGRALRGCHHHHGRSVSTRVRTPAAQRAGSAAPSLSTIVALLDWPAPSDAGLFRRPLVRPIRRGWGQGVQRGVCGAGHFSSGWPVGVARRWVRAPEGQVWGSTVLVRKGPEPGGVSSINGISPLG